jgi:hypothetical protein
VGGRVVGSVGRVLEGTVGRYVGAAAPNELVRCPWSAADCPVQPGLRVDGSCGVAARERAVVLQGRGPWKVVVLVDAHGATKQQNVGVAAPNVYHIRGRGCLTLGRVCDKVTLDGGQACEATIMAMSNVWLVQDHVIPLRSDVSEYLEVGLLLM